MCVDVRYPRRADVVHMMPYAGGQIAAECFREVGPGHFYVGVVSEIPLTARNDGTWGIQSAFQGKDPAIQCHEAQHSVRRGDRAVPRPVWLHVLRGAATELSSSRRY